MECNDYGIIYGLTNPYLQGLVKIGVTRRKSISARIRELGTAVPVPFECAFAYKVGSDRLFETERALHDFLDDKREGREFYRVDPAKVKNLLHGVGLKPHQEAQNEVQTAIEAEDAKRRPNMDFFALGLRAGDTLYYSKDKSVTCTIVSNKKVHYDGKDVALSSFTYKLLGYSVRVQPSPFWETKDGVRLSDIVARQNAVGIAAAQKECEQLIAECHEK